MCEIFWGEEGWGESIQNQAEYTRKPCVLPDTPKYFVYLNKNGAIISPMIAFLTQ